MKECAYYGHESQLFGVEEMRLCGGKGDGMRLLEVRNGKGSRVHRLGGPLRGYLPPALPRDELRVLLGERLRRAVLLRRQGGGLAQELHGRLSHHLRPAGRRLPLRGPGRGAAAARRGGQYPRRASALGHGRGQDLGQGRHAPRADLLDQAAPHAHDHLLPQKRTRSPSPTRSRTSAPRRAR
jgi:hypothetical protein